MTLQIGRITVLVHNVDEAVAFYVEKLGFSVLPDRETTPGAWAALVGPGTENDGALWFIPTTASDAVGDQTDGASLLTLYTDDLEAEIALLASRDLEVTKAVGRDEAYIRDLYGNQLILVERAERS